MEIIQVIRTTPGESKRIREFKSGMVGIAKGQVLRLNVVNTATAGSAARIVTVFCGLWSNPHSEPILQEKCPPMGPGDSMFHDVDWDAIEPGNETRHQVRAVVTVVDDVDRAFVVTLEVFDKDTGKTTVFTEVRDVPESQS
jgi:hypothetical protein